MLKGFVPGVCRMVRQQRNTRVPPDAQRDGVLFSIFGSRFPLIVHECPLAVVSLEELVPQDHFYRHRQKTLDLSFVVTTQVP